MPASITSDRITGAFFIADQYNDCVRIIYSHGIISTLITCETLDTASRLSCDCSFVSPSFLRCCPLTGDLFVVDGHGLRIRRMKLNRKWDSSQNRWWVSVIKTISVIDCGKLRENDHAFTQSSNIVSIVVCPLTGDVIVGDFFDNTIKRITSQGLLSLISFIASFLFIQKTTHTGEIKKLAGSGEQSVEKDGKGIDADLSSPSSLCSDETTGCIFVACFHDGVVKRILPDGTSFSLHADTFLHASHRNRNYAATFSRAQRSKGDYSGSFWEFSLGS